MWDGPDVRRSTAIIPSPSLNNSKTRRAWNAWNVLSFFSLSLSLSLSLQINTWHDINIFPPHLIIFCTQIVGSTICPHIQMNLPNCHYQKQTNVCSCRVLIPRKADFSVNKQIISLIKLDLSHRNKHGILVENCSLWRNVTCVKAKEAKIASTGSCCRCDVTQRSSQGGGYSRWAIHRLLMTWPSLTQLQRRKQR